MSEPAKPTPVVGTTIRYYREGWRTGVVEALNKTTVTIRPIAPKGKTVRSVKVAVEDTDTV